MAARRHRCPDQRALNTYLHVSASINVCRKIYFGAKIAGTMRRLVR